MPRVRWQPVPGMTYSDREWLAALPGVVDEMYREAVRDVLAAPGGSWAVVGEALGITRQSAWARFHEVVST